MSFLRNAISIVLAALLFHGAALTAEPLRTVPDTLAQRLQACTLCHGQEGRATNAGYFPRIAGKPADYLYHQLLNFRDGRRNNASMSYLLDHLSDAYLRDIAGHYAGLDLPYPPPLPTAASPTELARGQALVRQGDPARELPACATCHGAALTGVNPAVPGLLGLPRDYLMAQLGAWQTGLRKAFAPDCMAHVAQRLQPVDIAAVSSWLAAQPLPANAHPALPTREPLPLKCGLTPPGNGGAR